ncbi:MAG: hypothetical protein IJY23_04380 [Clostridia bacterium]|nr:hypothetical protein [Clostridia bacterium]
MIKRIVIKNAGYLYCNSNFYSSHDTIQSYQVFDFKTGINKLFGDIDSGIWGISYYISMFNTDVDKKLFSEPFTALVDGKEVTLQDLSKQACYLDQTVYPLFKSKRKTVYQLIKKGLKASGLKTTPEEICNLFSLSPGRIIKPIKSVGNERFRAMCAVGYAYGKQIFCFPWLSKKMINYYGNNISWLLDILEKLNVIVILPSGS